MTNCETSFEKRLPRDLTHRVAVGSVDVGGGAPVSVQSMCNTTTADVDATLAQIGRLAAAGRPPSCASPM